MTGLETSVRSSSGPDKFADDESNCWLSVPSDPDPAPPLRVPCPVTEERRAELDSLLRAMPLSRLISNGMEFADAHNLQSMARAGIDWIEAGVWLGERNIRLARKALTAGHRISARLYFRFASACFRFAQNAIPSDTETKKGLYQKMIGLFADAGALDNVPTEHWTVPYEQGHLCGWVMRPAGKQAPPVVIVLGGFDGWREEHYCSAAALVDRGIAVLLVDAPGQGETRLFHQLYLAPDAHRAISRMIDALSEDHRLGNCFGIWGNSFGGFLAAQAAIADERLSACCVNGGTVRPLEFPERYPRFFNKVEAMVGTSNRGEAVSIMEKLDISGSLAALRCPLLQLHSESDQVFCLENARRLYDLAQSRDKTLLIWADGDHCIYNHPHERNSIVSDWFCEKLGATAQ